MTRIVLMIVFALPLWAGDPLATISEPVTTAFGTYVPISVGARPGVRPYHVDEDLSNVYNTGQFELTPEQAALLQGQGFFATPTPSLPYGTGYNEMYDVYIQTEEEGIPVFITTDAVLHVYHRLFDHILQTIEEERFFPALLSLDSVLFDEALATDAALGKPSTRVSAAYFAVARKLLDPAFEVPAAYASIVDEELSLIEAHAGYSLSPLFAAYQEDYSQYVPRGHYTKSEALKRYFKAMMWHGRMAFVLSDTWGNPRPDLTGAALLLAQRLAREDCGNPWSSLYIPTTFFVGKSDDLLHGDYFQAALQVYGADFPAMEASVVLDPARIEAFLQAAPALLPDPEIPTLTPKGMRFMGQRFIPDSLILTRLSYPRVDERYLPKGLDVMAVLGSEEALEILEQSGDTALAGFTTQMAGLVELFHSTPAATWAQNLYWNWLYSLMPMVSSKGEGYPFFMQNEAWTRKDLNAALGSWTELRHDTILYAKQSTSGTGYPPYYYSVPAYVEPNPHLYGRLASLARYSQEGLKGLGLLNGDLSGRLGDLTGLLLNLKSISEKEWGNEVPTVQEFEYLTQFGALIQKLVTIESSPEPGGLPVQDPMPLVADVHTDPNFGNCLEEGVGHPLRLVAAVPVADRIYLAQGAVFSYYEFSRPMENRLTDEAWKILLKASDPPSPPEWTASFLDGASFKNTQPVHVDAYKIHQSPTVTLTPSDAAEHAMRLTVTVPSQDFCPATIENGAGEPLTILSVEEGETQTSIVFQLPFDPETLMEPFPIWAAGAQGMFTHVFMLKRPGHDRPLEKP